jgi:hypothetical protein
MNPLSFLIPLSVLILIQLTVLIDSDLFISFFPQITKETLSIFGFVLIQNLKNDSSPKSMLFALLLVLNFLMISLDYWKFQINSIFKRSAIFIKLNNQTIEYSTDNINSQSIDAENIRSISKIISKSCLLNKSDDESSVESFDSSLPKKKLNRLQIAKSFKDIMKNPCNKDICIVICILSFLNLSGFFSLTISVTYQDGLPGLFLSILFSSELILFVSKSKTEIHLKKLHTISFILMISSTTLIILIYVINCQPFVDQIAQANTWKVFELFAEEQFSEFYFNIKRLLALSFLLFFSCISRNYFHLRLEPSLSSSTKTLDFFDNYRLLETYAFGIIESVLLPVFKEVIVN